MKSSSNETSDIIVEDHQQTREAPIGTIVAAGGDSTTGTVVLTIPVDRDNVDEMISSNRTPHQPSPVAQAFFSAFDDSNSNSNSSKKKVEMRMKHQHQSPFIQKQIQTLGWRNRYSQNDFYPLTIETAAATAGSCTELNTTATTTTIPTTTTTFHVRQIQRGEIDETYGTGATVWPASIVLIKYLQRHASTLLHNKKVLDLGTGTGITSIATALLGARHIICTDGIESVVQLAKDNIQMAAREIMNHSNNNNNNGNNDVVYINNSSIEVQQYWWGTGHIYSNVINRNSDSSSSNDHPNIVNNFDIILISDCVLPKLYPIEPLIEAIDQLLGHRRQGQSGDDECDTDPKQQQHPPMAIVAYEYRYYEPYDPKQRVIELCAMKQLQLITIPSTEQDPIYSIPDDIEIWHIYRID